MNFIGIFSVAVIVVVSILLKKFYERRKLLHHIPGPQGLPLLGNLLGVSRGKGNPAENFMAYIESLRKKYGHRTKLFIGWVPHLILSDASDIQKVLGSNVHIEKPDVSRFFEEWLGSNVIFAKGEHWWQLRKLLDASFNFSMLQKFVVQMDILSGDCVGILEKKARTEKQINMGLVFKNLTLDILSKTAMDYDMNCMGGNHADYAVAFHGINVLTTKRWFSLWLHPRFVWKHSAAGKKWNAYKKIILNLSDKIIKDKKEQRRSSKLVADSGDENERKSRAFLDTLLDLQEEKNAFTDFQIRSETNLFIAAGHDTSATVLQWVLVRLGYHKEVQEKAYSELESIFEGDYTRHITYDDLCRMDYLEMVIRETLRMHPILPFIMRKLESALQLDENTVIEPGVNVIMNSALVHFDPIHYSSPDEFIPERFDAKSSSTRHPYAFLPFALGPRICLGHKFAILELKMVTAHILRRFNITSVQSPKEIEVEFIGAIRPRHGILINLTARD